MFARDENSSVSKAMTGLRPLAWRSSMVATNSLSGSVRFTPTAISAGSASGYLAAIAVIFVVSTIPGLVMLRRSQAQIDKASHNA